MKFYLNRKFLLGFVVSIGILATLGITSFLYIGKVVDLSRKGAREQRILFLSERVRSLITERESLIREYASINDASALKSYTDLSGSIQRVVKELSASTREDSTQRHNVQKLEGEVANSNGIE